MSHERAQLLPAGEPLRVVVSSGESGDKLRLLAAGGDSAAWVLLVDRYVELVWSWSLAQTDDERDAAGVCEVVWLRLADALPGREDEPLVSWLRGAVAEEAARLRRRRTIPAPRPAEQAAPGPAVLTSAVALRSVG